MADEPTDFTTPQEKDGMAFSATDGGAFRFHSGPPPLQAKMTAAEIEFEGRLFLVRQMARSDRAWELQIPGVQVAEREITFKVSGLTSYDAAIQAVFRLTPLLAALETAEAAVKEAKRTIQTFALGLIQEASQ